MEDKGAQTIGLGIAGSILMGHFIKEALSEFASVMISVINSITNTAGKYGPLLGFIGVASIIMICAKNRIIVKD